jgi:hypothetical protein
VRSKPVSNRRAGCPDGQSSQQGPDGEKPGGPHRSFPDQSRPSLVKADGEASVPRARPRTGTGFADAPGRSWPGRELRARQGQPLAAAARNARHPLRHLHVLGRQGRQAPRTAMPWPPSPGRQVPDICAHSRAACLRSAEALRAPAAARSTLQEFERLLLSECVASSLSAWVCGEAAWFEHDRGLGVSLRRQTPAMCECATPGPDQPAHFLDSFHFLVDAQRPAVPQASATLKRPLPTACCSNERKDRLGQPASVQAALAGLPPYLCFSW